MSSPSWASARSTSSVPWRAAKLRSGSDVDLLVEFDRSIGLFHFFRVQRRLEQILGCHVDLVMRDA